MPVAVDAVRWVKFTHVWHAVAGYASGVDGPGPVATACGSLLWGASEEVSHKEAKRKCRACRRRMDLPSTNLREVQL